MKEVWDGLSEDEKNVYGPEYLTNEYERFQIFCSKWNDDVASVIRCMRSGLLSKNPLRRYVVGCGARTLLLSTLFLPLWATDWIALLFGFTPQDVSPLSLRNNFVANS